MNLSIYMHLWNNHNPDISNTSQVSKSFLSFVIHFSFGLILKQPLIIFCHYKLHSISWNFVFFKNHTLCTFCHLTSFIQHNYFEIHTRRCTQLSFESMVWIYHNVFIHSFTYQEIFELFPVWSYNKYSCNEYSYTSHCVYTFPFSWENNGMQWLGPVVVIV